MAQQQYWKKAQSERLETERAQELKFREQWYPAQRPKSPEKKEEEAEHSQWTWGSWWWHSAPPKWWPQNWSDSQASSAAWNQGSQYVDEPTAFNVFVPPTAKSMPHRTPNEDKRALRNAAMTPASFMPQRHVTMALGRPVVVLQGTQIAL